LSRRLRELDRAFGNLVVALALADTVEQAEADTPLISVVIPAYNEADAIMGVLRALPSALAGHRVEPIVVVDGATDGTECVVDAAGFVTIKLRVNRGQGDALRAGFAYALRRGAAIVMTMDADGQHRPEEMIDLVKPILGGEADYVQGSRVLGSTEDSGGARGIGIRLFTRAINAVAGLSITDCTNGFRAIRADALARLQLEEPRFSGAEILIEAARRDLRVLEVPVRIRARSHGASKKPPRLGYPIGFLGALVRTARRS
jgi:glycosyltransferase involved in cell wall biosynthesis